MNVPATQQSNLPGQQGDSFIGLIERALRDPDVDVDKLQRLLDLREIEANRVGEKMFTAALVRAQAEMQPINADANNPQTRSRYATYAQLDRECRPIYTKYGLGPTFTTEPTGDPNTIMVVGIMGHNSGFSRRYQIPMPIDTKGARGGDVMTRTHATGSAFSYGKRYLLIGMFNLAIDDSIDGSHRRATAPQVHNVGASHTYTRSDADERIDPETGEVFDQPAPFTIEMNTGSTWGQFVEPLQRYVLAARTIQEVDEWLLKNQDMLLKLKDSKPVLFRQFEQNIDPHKEELTRQ